MEDREDALDFIYKGWREGRQNRRNVVRQRGLDRTRSMLGPIMAQRARGSMASMPPSYPVLMPEYETPTEASSVQNVAETVSTPPAPKKENDMTNDITVDGDHPDDYQPVQATPEQTASAGSDDFITRINNDEERRQWIEEGQVKDTETPSINENAKRMVNEHVKNKFNEKLTELSEKAGAKANDESLSQNQRDDAALRQKLIEGMKSGMSDEELREMAKEGGSPEHEKAFEEAYEQMKEEATKTEKITPPPKKATDEGKEGVKRRADTLAAFGMGFKDDQPDE